MTKKREELIFGIGGPDCPEYLKGYKTVTICGSRYFEECTQKCGYHKERDDIRKRQVKIGFADRRVEKYL